MRLNLEKIHIENFYSYKNAVYDYFKDYNVIIGKNNSGKSNLFKLFSLLKKNTSKEEIKVTDIFDEDINLDNKITMIFNISKQLKLDIYSILYDQNTLLSIINFYKQNPNIRNGFQPHPNWRIKNEIIEWLVDKDLFNKLSIEIEYDKLKNFLRLKRIQVIHNFYNNQQTLFEIQSEINQEAAYIPNLQELNKIPRSLEGFFKFNQLKKLPLNTTYSLRKILSLKSDKDAVKRHMPLLILIFDSLFNDFFNVIHVIPAKRIFDSDSDRDNLSRTELDLNGKNLVKFIHKKAAKQEGEWLREWNHEFKHFIDDLKELKQDIKKNERSTLILKEKGLNMEILLESMGSGILNIAHFLAYIKTLESPSIICIEEPELHLHPGLMENLKQKFIETSNKNQVFITTHSREFLSKNEEKCSIYLTNKRDNQTTLNLIPKERFQDIYDELEMDIDEYNYQESLLYRDSFWQKFESKIRVKEEDQLWDYKETLSMWNKADPTPLEKKRLKFCTQIGALANADGGVLIVGISNKTPRRVVGIQDLEDKKKTIKNTIEKHIETTPYFINDIEVSIEDNSGIAQQCLFIVVSQTKEPIEVYELNEQYFYPLRNGSENIIVKKSKILDLKKEVKRTNLHFLRKLEKLADDSE